MPRSAVIGDVHGCLTELHDLLNLLALRDGDRLFFLGDLVDRGPDSVGVVQAVRELLQAYPGSAVVCGNHEEKQLRLRDQGRPLHSWAGGMNEDQWNFLDALPIVHSVPDLGVILVHGGFFPRFFSLHGPIDGSVTGWRKAKGKRAERMRRFLRIRQVDADGNMASLDDPSKGLRHWSETYDGSAGFCFFGHDPQLEPPQPLRATHATGLDTGCCFGGRLTAAVLTEGARPGDATFVSVPARAQYAAPRLMFEE
jgi:hypothetical protein